MKRANSLETPVTSGNESYIQCFHVSQLKKCLCVPEEAIEPTSIKIQSDLTYEERPIRLLEEMERVTHSSH